MEGTAFSSFFRIDGVSIGYGTVDEVDTRREGAPGIPREKHDANQLGEGFNLLRLLSDRK
jgi:hypothetical protein